MVAMKRKYEQCDWEIENKRFDDPDYYPSDPTTYSPAKKGKTKRRNTVQLKSKASDSSKKSGRINGRKKNARYGDLYDNNLAQFSVLVVAERTLASLQNDIPHFVKCMLPSNVEDGFWMHIPREFCSLHLPNHDSRIVLVDERGNEYKTTFKLAKYGLSAGWRSFSFEHELKRGEILIFQLMGPCKIKVHIVRVPNPDDISAAILIMNMSGSCIQPNPDIKKKIKAKQKMLLKNVPFPLDISSQLKNRRRCTTLNCQLCNISIC